MNEQEMVSSFKEFAKELIDDDKVDTMFLLKGALDVVLKEMNNRMEMVNLLVENGANIDDHDKSDRTALMSESRLPSLMDVYRKKIKNLQAEIDEYKEAEKAIEELLEQANGGAE